MSAPRFMCRDGGVDSAASTCFHVFAFHSKNIFNIIRLQLTASIRAGRLRTEMDLSLVLHIRVVAVRDSWGLMTMTQ